MTKRCIKCGEDKPVEMFYRRGEAAQRHTRRSDCIACNRSRNKAWRAANPERDRISERNGHLRREFGITVADEQRMIAACGNRCQICGLPPSGVGRSTRRLHVDHDAQTGRIRGLLCSKCNQGIGMFNHEGARLLAAVEYLYPT